MAKIQKQFEEFHDNIKLGRFEENKTLREKRDIIKDKIKNGIKKKFEDEGKNIPSLEFIDQGSYATDLGINPEDGDYDIDEGVIFDLNKEDFTDPVEPKKWIMDIMDGHTTIPTKIKNPCVTITYCLNEEPTYHVDLPIYFKSKYDNKLYLARGKEFSSDENKEWEVADPEGLNNHINNAFSDDAKIQFKRVVRYLKKWKDICFSSSGHEKPASIGITIAATNLFHYEQSYNSVKGKYEDDDLSALSNLVWNISSCFKEEWDKDKGEFLKTIKINFPGKPNTNLFSKMSNTQMNNFYNKLEKLHDVLQDAAEKDDPHDACEILAKYFGDKFPIPPTTESRYQTAKSSAPSANFA